MVDIKQVLTRLADGARQTLQADASAVRLLDKRKGKPLSWRLAATSGLPDADAQELAVSGPDPHDEEALSHQMLVVVADARADPQATSVPPGYRSALYLPLTHEDAPIGLLHVYAAESHRFDERDGERLTPLVDLATALAMTTRALQDLESLEGSKAHFIHVATHELRSPVAVSQSLVRGVLKGYAGPLGEQQADMIGRISRKLDFLENLVNDLLDLAAGKASDLTEEETAVVLNASVGRAVLLMMPRAEEKGVELIHRACCEELVVRGTEDGLDRIFVNLVSNGIKYTPAGGSVTVILERVSEETIQVQVVDTGIGIPEEALPHLFEEFYRAPNAKASNEIGTGLGLSIVKDLVDRYNGRIKVESKLEEGTTFTVTFPVLHILDDEAKVCRLPSLGLTEMTFELSPASVEGGNG